MTTITSVIRVEGDVTMHREIRNELLLPAGAWIETSAGPRQVADLVGEPFAARGSNGMLAEYQGFRVLGKRAALTLETRSGIEIALDPQQQVLIQTGTRQKGGGGVYVDRSWKAVKDVREKDKICLERIPRPSGLIDPREEALGLLLGQMVGDGGFNPTKYAGYVRFWQDHGKDQAARAAETVKAYLDVDRRFGGATYNKTNETWQVTTKSLDKLATGLIEPGTKNLLPALEKKGPDFVRGFLAGFFNTDGSPQGTEQKGYSVRLSQVDISKLQAVQRMLLRLGIDATIYKNRSVKPDKLMPDGKGGTKLYQTQPVHELVISRNSLMTFRRIINFKHPEKSAKLADMTENRKRPFYRNPFVAAVLSVSRADSVEMFACDVGLGSVLCANGLILGAENPTMPEWLPYRSVPVLQGTA